LITRGRAYWRRPRALLLSCFSRARNMEETNMGRVDPFPSRHDGRRVRTEPRVANARAGHAAVINCRRVSPATWWRWAWATTRRQQPSNAAPRRRTAASPAWTAWFRGPPGRTTGPGGRRRRRRRRPCPAGLPTASLRWSRVFCLCRPNVKPRDQYRLCSHSSPRKTIPRLWTRSAPVPATETTPCPRPLWNTSADDSSCRPSVVELSSDNNNNNNNNNLQIIRV